MRRRRIAAAAAAARSGLDLGHWPRLGPQPGPGSGSGWEEPLGAGKSTRLARVVARESEGVVSYWWWEMRAGSWKGNILGLTLLLLFFLVDGGQAIR